jgi:hypothetical protein
MPTTLAQFAKVDGCGEVRATKYGTYILEAIAEFQASKGAVSAPALVKPLQSMPTKYTLTFRAMHFSYLTPFTSTDHPTLKAHGSL